MIKKIIQKWLEIDKLKKAIYARDEYIKFLRDTLQIGIDIHFKKEIGKSWAVICLNGKADYVNFFLLNHNNIREIQEFLRRFKEENVNIDYMPATKNLFF